ncbi:acyl carrier protein [Saccharothrix xinjiangensis]|uniref:Acyl carrier protein n=1 Tax=Saccharothrix xinjiangensis TaxID=204798 RepID=A0ABV9Y1P2_9PSEU
MNDESQAVVVADQPATAEPVEQALLEFLRTRLKTEVDPAQDLFGSGLVSSLFAMELVVHLEQSFGIAVVGRDLRLDNFRSVRSMSALVHRLQDVAGGG